MAKRVRRVGALIILATLLALVPAACGGDEDAKTSGGDSGETTSKADGNGPQNLAELIEMHPSSVVKRFLKASLEGDGEAACAELSPAARKRVVGVDAGSDATAACALIVAATATESGEEATITIDGKPVTADEVDDLEPMTTITQVGKRSIARVAVPGMKQPVTLNMYDEVWLIEKVPASLKVRPAS